VSLVSGVRGPGRLDQDEARLALGLRLVPDTLWNPRLPVIADLVSFAARFTLVGRHVRFSRSRSQ